MTDKQAAMVVLERLPEGASMTEITEELQIIAGIRQGREDVAAGRTKTQAEAERALESWMAGWTTK
jgi:predicted transcriptional regulator